jgi:hypothetical protein
VDQYTDHHYYSSGNDSIGSRGAETRVRGCREAYYQEGSTNHHEETGYACQFMYNMRVVDV